MSTRCSIYYGKLGHMFYEALEGQENGLYLDFHPEQAPNEEHRDSFAVEWWKDGKSQSVALRDVDGMDASIRIPWPICQAIARFVADGKTSFEDEP